MRGRTGVTFHREKLPAMDKTTLIAASVPALLLLGIVVFLLYNWRRHRIF